jgi:hypothetical protein
MVSLKISSFTFRGKFPLKTIGKSNVRRQFKHVSCTEEELVKYFKDAMAARNAISELNSRSWEYTFEFVVEMVKQCNLVMGDNSSMKQALEVYERW